MNKGEFVSELAKRTDLSVNKAGEILKEVETIIKDELQRGEEINLTGFVSFKTGVRAARTGRNPQTGKEMKISAKTVPAFKAGKALKDIVNK